MGSQQKIEQRDAFAGGCYLQGESICVYEPKDYCDDGTFESAHFLRANGGHPLRSCAYDIHRVTIGRCGDNGECTNHASRCNDPSSFNEYDETCGVIRDRTSGKLTTYGKCNDRCVWSSDDCLEGETWVSNDPDCTSDKVEIGACMAGHTFCAVSSAMCVKPAEPYISHKEALETRFVKCILSSIDPTPAPNNPTRPPTRPPTMNPALAPDTFMPTTGSLDRLNARDTVTPNNIASVSAVEIILILVGFLLALILILLMLKIVACRKGGLPQFGKSIETVDNDIEETPAKEIPTKKEATKHSKPKNGQPDPQNSTPAVNKTTEWI